MDNYLKNATINVEIKRKILAAVLKSIPWIQIKDDKFLIIDELKETETKPLDDILSNEDLDYDFLLCKLQYTNLLLEQRPEKIFIFKQYEKRCLQQWLILYPWYNYNEILQQAKTKSLVGFTSLQLQKVKNEIHERPMCNVCKNEPIQYCAVCKLIYYCSSICQTNDWQRHKISCFTFP